MPELNTTVLNIFLKIEWTDKSYVVLISTSEMQGNHGVQYPWCSIGIKPTIYRIDLIHLLMLDKPHCYFIPFTAMINASPF